jgi:hypothetical protein
VLGDKDAAIDALKRLLLELDPSLGKKRMSLLTMFRGEGV